MDDTIEKLIVSVKGDFSNIEKLIYYLKTEKKCTQMHCLKFIKHEFNLSIKEADDIILDSLVWSENRKSTVALRNAFADFLENLEISD